MVVEATKDDPDSRFYWRNFLELLEVRGSRNEHLSDPRYGPLHGFRKRKSPLKGSEPVYGSYLTLDYIGHDPAMVLVDFDDLPSLEEHICSGAGYLNHFTTLMVAIVHGRVRPFRIFYDGDGSQPVLFRKKDQYRPKIDFGAKYPNPRLEWDGPANI